MSSLLLWVHISLAYFSTENDAVFLFSRRGEVSMVQILASENFYSLASRGGGNRIRKEIFGTRSMVMEVETTHAIRVQRRHPLARHTSQRLP